MCQIAIDVDISTLAGLVFRQSLNVPRSIGTRPKKEEFKMASSKVKKVRQVMYVQQLDKMKITINQLDTSLKKSGAEFAYIIHDKDKHEDGTKVKDHIHVVVKFTNPRSLNSIAKLFKDKQQYVEIVKGENGYNNALGYLCHRTLNAISKFQYDPKDVVADFDYVKRLKLIQAKVHKSTSKDGVNKQIAAYANSEIDKDTLKASIGVLEMAKHSTLIKNIDAELDKTYFQEWIAKNKNIPLKVLYIYGPTGVGKSKAARKYFSDKGEDYIVLAGSRDPFQFYSCRDKGAENVIIDDLRPDSIEYSDLLRITDNYNPEGRIGSSRYSNKLLTLKTLIITTPYEPYTFYLNTSVLDRAVDSFDQFARRIKVMRVYNDKLMTEDDYNKIDFSKNPPLYNPFL